MNAKHARTLRKTMTDAGRRLWQRLKCRQIGGVKFRRQQPLGPFIADFACFERRVVIEVDGGQHAEQGSYDEYRTRWLETQGYRVLRFWDTDVLTGTDAAAQAILGVVESSVTPTPTLPHQGGGS